MQNNEKRIETFHEKSRLYFKNDGRFCYLKDLAAVFFRKDPINFKISKNFP